jgi:hypothetical protein
MGHRQRFAGNLDMKNNAPGYTILLGNPTFANIHKSANCREVQLRRDLKRTPVDVRRRLTRRRNKRHGSPNSPAEPSRQIRC